MLMRYFRSKAIKLLLVGSLFAVSVPGQALGAFWSKKKQEKVSLFNRGLFVFARKYPVLSSLGIGAGLLCSWGIYNWVFNSVNIFVSLANKFKKRPIQKFYQEMPFDQWRQACQALPKYGTVSPGEKYNNTTLTRQEFERVINELVDVMKTASFADDNNWVGTSGPQKEYFECNAKKELDKFFVQKLLCTQDVQVSIHADIHADVHSTVAYVDDLVQKGWIDNNFAITHPNLYVVFLGDYTDRGYYGAEVLYTVARLKVANPQRVILLRGNHEDIDINYAYGLIKHQIMVNGFGSYFKDGELISKFGFKAGYATQLVTMMYRMMPAALFIGRLAKNAQCYTDYALLCHGGIEPGFNPLALLSDARTNLCQWLDVLNIDWLDQRLQDLLKENADFSDVDCQASNNNLGFLWNDFIIDKTTIALGAEGRGPSLGMEISKKLLEQYSSEKDKYRVKCVFRGHQHNGEMMQKMKKYNGLYNLWSDNQFDESLTAMNLAQAPPVWVLNVSPCSPYGTGGGYAYDTYGLLRLNGQYDDWVLEPHNVSVANTGQ